jgi:hypothetical protein
VSCFPCARKANDQVDDCKSDARIGRLWVLVCVHAAAPEGWQGPGTAKRPPGPGAGWAFCSLRGSPGAKTYYQQLRDRHIGHQAALRQLANRLVGILHGCLKTGTLYDETTAWSHHVNSAAA